MLAAFTKAPELHQSKEKVVPGVSMAVTLLPEVVLHSPGTPYTWAPLVAWAVSALDSH